MLSVVLARLVRRYCGERQGFTSCISRLYNEITALLASRTGAQADQIYS